MKFGLIRDIALIPALAAGLGAAGYHLGNFANSTAHHRTAINNLSWQLNDAEKELKSREANPLMIHRGWTDSYSTPELVIQRDELKGLISKYEFEARWGTTSSLVGAGYGGLLGATLGFLSLAVRLSNRQAEREFNRRFA